MMYGIANPFPPRVRCVGVFSPAGVPDPERLARGVARLEGWGLDVVDGTTAPRGDCFLAGADDERVAALHELLRSPHVDMLIASRGGYGCARLLPAIDWELLRRSGKAIVGYSDVTALHLGGLAHGAAGGIVGPMVAAGLGRLCADAAAQRAFRDAMASFAAVLRGECRVPALQPALHCLRAGEVAGRLVPATLSVLVTLLGTAHMPDLTGAILVLEDTHEPAYRIDRCLTQLQQAGVWEGLGGVVFGDFSACEDAHRLGDVFAEFATRARGPVAAGLAFGHCFPSLSLPVGREGVLHVSNSHVSLRLE